MMKTEIEIPAPDFDGYYCIRPEDDGHKWSVTVYCDCFRHGGQNAKEWECDEWFESADDAIYWCEAHYEDFLNDQAELDGE